MYLKWLLYYIYEVIWLFITVYIGVMYFLIPQDIYQQFPNLRIFVAIIFLLTLGITLIDTLTDSKKRILIQKNNKI